MYLVHIFSPVTDNCPPWISGRERMAVEMNSWPKLQERTFLDVKIEPLTVRIHVPGGHAYDRATAPSKTRNCTAHKQSFVEDSKSRLIWGMCTKDSDQLDHPQSQISLCFLLEEASMVTHRDWHSSGWLIWVFPGGTCLLSHITWKCIFGDFWPGMTQTGLLSYSD